MEELADAVRNLLAWRHVCDRVEDLDLTYQQSAMAGRRRDDADSTVDMRLAGAYIWALVPDQPASGGPPGWRVLKAESSQPRLADRVAVKLRQEGLLATVYGARSVRIDLDGPLAPVWSRGHISVGDLWSYYLRYPYLTRLRDRSVLDAAVRSVLDEFLWEAEGFALADGFDEATGRYWGLAIPHESSFGAVTDSTLLVLPGVARQQQEADRAEAAAGTATAGGPAAGEQQPFDGPVPAGAGGPDAPPAGAPAGPDNVRFFGAVRLNPARYGRDLTRVAQEVLQHLAAVEGSQLEIRVEISAVKPEGFPSDTVRIVTENARTLKFDQFGFEKD
jgi:hypothetical protein